MARDRSPYRRGRRHMIAALLAAPAIMWGIPSVAAAVGADANVAMLVVAPLALVWFVYFSVGSLMIACPNCRRSVFLRKAFLSVPWPARRCSKCGRDLTLP